MYPICLMLVLNDAKQQQLNALSAATMTLYVSANAFRKVPIVLKVGFVFNIFNIFYVAYVLVIKSDFQIAHVKSTVWMAAMIVQILFASVR